MDPNTKSFEKCMMFIFTFTDYDICCIGYEIYTEFMNNKATTYPTTTKLKNYNMAGVLEAFSIAFSCQPSRVLFTLTFVIISCFICHSVANINICK